MPGFDPSDEGPKKTFQMFLAKERNLRVEERAVLMVFAPNTERNQVEPSSFVHLATLQECGLFSVASVSELPPIVFVRNNTNGLNEVPDADKRLSKSIPHFRKIVYSAFDVRDRESESISTNVDGYEKLQVSGPHPSLTSLAFASQIADHIADQLADNYRSYQLLFILFR
jgi:DNA-binding PucR family transcriptional regulator